MSSLPQTPSPLQDVHEPSLVDRGIRLLIKRDDLIHAHVSGNKWRKLKYNLAAARRQTHTTLLTFGGAYSNHIYATAAAGQWLGFRTIGVIRGEERLPLNPTLRFATACGMTLYYLDRTHYRQKNTPAILDRLQSQFGRFYLIPEGGTNTLAMEGCRELVAELLEQTQGNFDLVTTACATGGTLAGIAGSLPQDKHVLGFVVLKGGDFLTPTVQELLGSWNRQNWILNLNYHFGGYAKHTPQLLGFCKRFTTRHRIPIEPIYTAKMLYAHYDLAAGGALLPGTTVVAIHTGGLQGFTKLARARVGCGELANHILRGLT
jgi:1-aminocyclopropane-1-carboxylate deaminase/D-cysteine desulfhydrase-like pyridoxal-dependent ACC family enzyme